MDFYPGPTRAGHLKPPFSLVSSRGLGLTRSSSLRCIQGGVGVSERCADRCSVRSGTDTGRVFPLRMTEWRSARYFIYSQDVGFLGLSRV